MFNDLVIPATLTDLLEAKEYAVRQMETARKIVSDTEAKLNECGAYLYPQGAKLQDSHERALADLNRRMWQRSFDLTGFRNLMDAEAIAAFDRDLEKNPPDFSEGNIRSTFLSLHQDSENMFRRGLVNVFRQLASTYRTNSKEPFRVGPKVICEFMVTNSHAPALRVNYGNRATATLDDLDRVFRVLDEQEFKPRRLEAAINAAWQDGSNIYEDGYFRIKGFKKGTMHITFLRDELLEKANNEIAIHYGENKLAG